MDREEGPPHEGAYRNGPPPRGPPGRDRSPLRDPYPPYDDLYGPDPYRDPRDLPPPPRREDPYLDPYRRGSYPPPPGPYYDPYHDDPYRRDPYFDPYREYERRPPPVDDYQPVKKPPPLECEIITTTRTLLDYGHTIRKRLKPMNLVTEVIVIPEERTLQQQIEDCTARKVLFAVVINSQNEVHQSLTLNILHGAPEEHRNMPLEDAVKLVAKSFEKYLETQRAKQPAPPPPAAAPPIPAAPKMPFLPPSREVGYLLNLLADNRHLTIEELDKVMLYLRDRRDHLLGLPLPPSESRPAPAPPAPAPAPAPAPMPAPASNPAPAPIASYTTVASLAPTPVPVLVPIPAPASAAVYRPAGGVDAMMARSLQEHDKLQSTILSILNGGAAAGSGSSTATTGSGLASILATQQQPSAKPQPAAAATPIGSTPLINLDNPSVQKAIDSLIQSGPNLLRSISAATSSASTTRPITASRSDASFGSAPPPRSYAPPQAAPPGPPRGPPPGHPQYPPPRPPPPQAPQYPSYY